ncbi:MAG TPA: aldo/keto reductase [Chthonomonadaceae bacterium]|nr:aldo/keto reductase [Chthonomonadaceae bacterium]
MIPTVSLGKSGLKVSVLCLGCMNFGESTSEPDSLAILKAAHEAGVTFWDTADVYSQGRSEEILGKAFRTFGFRDDIVLATKVHGAMGPGPNDRGLSRRHIRAAVEASLRRLQTDYIDLYQMHRYDPTTPLDETLETLDTLTREGKIRYYGTSTFASWQMADAYWRAKMRNWVEPVCEQAPYNLLDRRIENDRAGFLAQAGWGVIAWSPLAGGQLTGKYGQVAAESLPEGSRVARNAMWRQRINRNAAEVSLAFTNLAREHGLSPAQVAIAWVRSRPLVTAPIIGPRTMEQFTDLLPAAELSLPDSLLSALDELVPPGTAVADFHNNAGWQVGHLPGLDDDRTGTA